MPIFASSAACFGAVALSLLTLAATSSFAVAAGGNAVQSQYLEDRAACERLAAGQDREACLREAAAARNEARRAIADQPEPDYAANALRRCEALRGRDQDDCVARMKGGGSVSGSVEGGGIFREYVTTTVPEPKPGSGPEPR